MGRILGLHGGFGGFGSEVQKWVCSGSHHELFQRFDEIYLIDDFVDRIPTKVVTRQKILSRTDFIEKKGQHELFFNILIGDSKVRQKIWEFYAKHQVAPATLVAPTAEVNSNLQQVEGGVFCQNSIVTTDAKIGKGCQVNIYSYIAHDCEIGDFVTFAPRASCNGHVVIKKGAYVGTGAVIRNGSRNSPLTIGAGAVVGMGAVVTKDVAPNTTVVGMPAKPLPN